MKNSFVILILLVGSLYSGEKTAPQAIYDPRVFNAEDYLNIYPDLMNAYGEGNSAGASDHWLKYGLVNEGRRAVHENAQFHNSLDPLKRAERCLDLRKQHHAAAQRGLNAALQIHILAEPPFDEAAIFGEADLARDVQQPPTFDRRNVGGDGRGGLGKGDAKFG